MLTSLMLIPLYTGVVFTVAGFLMLKFPPKKVNAFYGYRTPASMKSQERWDFAQVLSSKEMIKTGLLLMLSSLLGFVFDSTEKDTSMLGMLLLIIAAGAFFIRVERAIKKRFGND